jgi:Dickkopf N-terminal cysteine-rich region
MRSTRSGLQRLCCMLLLCAACEIHTGDSRWDAAFPWDEDDSGASTGKDAGRDARAADEDGGADGRNKDAAISGNSDAGMSGDMPIDSGLPPIDEPTDLKPDAFADTLAKGRCGALQNCIGAAMLLESYRGNDCVEALTHQYQERDLHWLTKAVALGHVKFRGDQLAKCQSDIVALGCDVQSRRLPASCEQAVEGTIDVDGACSIDQECTGNDFCDKGTLETCPGSCAALQSNGLPCSTSSQCNDGLLCRGGTCSAPAAEGDACSQYLVFGECPPGLVCQGMGSPNSLTCQSIATLYSGKNGDACDAYGKLCQSGLACASQSTSNTKGLCAPIAAAGGKCRAAVPSQCPSEQYCKNSSAGSTARVAPGKDGVCSDKPGAGQDCDAANGCGKGTVCLTTDGQCHTYKRDGETCVEDRECYGGSCPDGTCAEPLQCLN